ncbi:hypothetical protein VP1G_06812 [Cytospora mali]|uniref:Transcription factor Iwr1 domain-containing protein n=1 Tax=Cytospora mali TaxID=578113 RepID=A0A194V6T2_CYTMA|nr:hypothetical protein VP1G_06812 [Valsa mali var. pyri (nom. inval.)]
MSLPPEFIQVKRLKNKRKADDDNDEGVVDYLRVDGDRKRHRSGAFIYQRRRQQVADFEHGAGRQSQRHTSRDSFPVIHATKPGDENRPDDKVQTPHKKSKLDATPQTPPKLQDEAIKEQDTAPKAVRTTPKSKVASEPRRFHLSRVSFAPSPLFNPNMATGKRSRFNAPTTVFVERGHKRTRTEDVTMADADAAPVTVTEVESSEPPRKHKLPGADRKVPTGSSGKLAPVKKDVPKSMKKEHTSEMDDLARDMNEFVLQQIGENLARIEERDRKEAATAAKKTISVTSPQFSKFKPKAPTKRYAERHPEVAGTPEKAATAALVDSMELEYESHSEDEYIVETYIRVPATSLGKNVDPEKIGLLVFDNEPDVDYFYGEEGDSDDEWPEDDEDENAENYYTADYPDDEVDSEDEYNRHAYDFRTGNASDLEEYDERDEDYVLDDGDDEKPVPFSARFGARPPAAFRGL